jgi:hypothetical protein
VLGPRLHKIVSISSSASVGRGGWRNIRRLYYEELPMSTGKIEQPLFVPQGDDGIHAHGAPRRDQAAERGGDNQRGGRDQQRDRIGR